jgi:hypothetical protein
MCDCWQCNMTEEQQAEEAELYIEWEYEQYCRTTDNPLPIEEWLKQFESPIQKEENK